MDKLIITAALVGAEVTKEQQPNLPVTPEEIVLAAEEACRAGASIIHLHVRDSQGQPTQDKEIFRQVIQGIKERCDAVIQVSTGGAVGMSSEERLQPVTLRPEMATLSTGSVNFGDEVFLNPWKAICSFAKAMQQYGVKPEIEVFEAGMIENAKRLLKEDLLTAPLHFDLVLGVPGAIPADPKTLLYLVDCLPQGSTFTVAGIGRQQLPMAVMAIIMGGHVRVGFEDNIFYSRGVLARSNAQLVSRVAALARELGREIASPEEARIILGLRAAR